MLRLADIEAASVRALLSRHGLELVLVAEGEPIRFHVSAGRAGHDRVRSRQATEELMRPGKVEMRHARIDREENAKLRVGFWRHGEETSA